jgi:hypothetical protein
MIGKAHCEEVKFLFERQFFRCIVLAETGHKNIHNLTFVLHYFVVLREFQIYIFFFWSDRTGCSNSTEHYWNFKNKHFLSLTYLKLWSDPLFWRNSHCDYWGMLSCKVKLPLWKKCAKIGCFYGWIEIFFQFYCRIEREIENNGTKSIFHNCQIFQLRFMITSSNFY